MTADTTPARPVFTTGPCGCTCEQCRDTDDCGGCGHAVCDVRPRYSAAAAFPHGWPGYVCYFTVAHDGRVSALRTREEMRAGVRAALADRTTLYAAWPGEHRTDLFLVDDLDVLAARIKERREDRCVRSRVDT